MRALAIATLALLALIGGNCAVFFLSSPQQTGSFILATLAIAVTALCLLGLLALLRR